MPTTVHRASLSPEGHCMDGKPVVLVVEDETIVRKLLERQLTACGYQAVAAGTGAEAVAAVAAHPGRVALALVDVNLPDRPGPDVIAALRAVDPALPCVLMSGSSLADLNEAAASGAAAAVLTKPFTLVKLRETLGYARQVMSG